ncbi:hypothetical protein SK128_011771 [Halocaridina rubra]|uniref:Uncharacterized protein n=1 Tax=Halocaridina rubra TaxID=373956 RepID=A0AAN9ADC1_HALRR
MVITDGNNGSAAAAASTPSPSATPTATSPTTPTIATTPVATTVAAATATTATAGTSSPVINTIDSETTDHKPKKLKVEEEEEEKEKEGKEEKEGEDMTLEEINFDEASSYDLPLKDDPEPLPPITLFNRIDPIDVFKMYKTLWEDVTNELNIHKTIIDYYNLLVRHEDFPRYYTSLQSDTYYNIIQFLEKIRVGYEERLYNFLHEIKPKDEIVKLYDDIYSKLHVKAIPPGGTVLDDFYPTFLEHFKERADDVLPMLGFVVMEIDFVPNDGLSLIIPSGEGERRLDLSKVDHATSKKMELRFYINYSFNEKRYRTERIDINKHEVVIGVDPTIVYVNNENEHAVMLGMTHRFIFNRFK